MGMGRVLVPVPVRVPGMVPAQVLALVLVPELAPVPHRQRADPPRATTPMKQTVPSSSPVYLL
jgi:hypothetical protein